MIKKLSVLTLLLFVSGLLLAGCYVIGVLQYWTIISIFLLWITVIFTTIAFKFFYTVITIFFQNGYHQKIIAKYKLSRKEYALYSVFKKGIKIVRNKQFKKSNIPWFILIGNHESKYSLLKGTSLPLCYNVTNNSLNTPLNGIRWFFFKTMGLLELSDKLVNQPQLNIRNRLLKWIAGNPNPSGIIVFLSVSDLMSPADQEIHNRCLRFRQFINEIYSKTKQRIPVYSVITDCGAIEGFSLWQKHLCNLGKNIPVGFYWDNEPYINDKGDETLHESFTKLKESMGLLRIKILENELPVNERYSVLSFPERFYSLEESLKILISEMCEHDAYLSACNLSGIWFIDTDDNNIINNKSQKDTLLADLLPRLTLQGSSYSKGYDIRKFTKWVIIAATYSLLSSGAYQAVKILKQENKTPEDIIKKIQSFDSFTRSSPVNFAFIPIISWHQSQLYEQLRGMVPFKKKSIQDVIQQYRDKFYSAPPKEKRELLLDLANVIIIWNKGGVNPSILNDKIDLHFPSALRITNVSRDISEEISLAIEHSEFMWGYENKLDDMRKLLNEFIQHDNDFLWLVAPSETIPNVSLSSFWPDYDGGIYLDGVWTLSGQKKIKEWISLFYSAGLENRSTQVLNDFFRRITDLRQDVWHRFIIEASLERKYSYATRTNRELLELINKESSEIKFLTFLKEELDDIPNLHAHEWLVKFRGFFSLLSLSHKSSLIHQIQQSEMLLRMRVSSVINNNDQPLTEIQLTSWWSWLENLNSAVNEALNNEYTGHYLIRGLYFSNKDQNNPNPLAAAFDDLGKLKIYLYSDNVDPTVDAIWKIYESQAYILLDNAIARAGSWLNKKWSETVLFPLRNDMDNLEHLSLQDKAYTYLMNFLHGPAKGLFFLSETGLTSLEFEGRKLLVHKSFIDLINTIVKPDDLLKLPLGQNVREKDEIFSIQSKLESLTTQLNAIQIVPYTVEVSSGPATISKGAKIIPIGTRLKLHCGSDTQVLDSLNFAESASFTWKAGQCQNVSIDVKFPSFIARYTLIGDTAWTDFLELFSDGEAELATDKFPHETAYSLRALGIKSILVRYKVSDRSTLVSAFDEWHRLKKEIDNLFVRQNTLLENTPSQKSVNNQGWLSLLPVTIYDESPSN